MQTLILFIVSSLVQAGNLPILETLKGAQSLNVISGKTLKPVKQGKELTLPAKIKTDAHTTAVVKFPGGSRMMIGKKTDLEIEKKTKYTQWAKLGSGFVRTEVTKPAQLSKKYLFGYKTKSAVMGVRGTIFDVTADAQKKSAELRTLEGSVEVAKDEKSLFSGKGIPVLENQLSKISAQSIGAAAPFNRDEYLERMKSIQPNLPALPALADTGAAGEEAKKRMEAQMGQIKTPTAPVVPPVSIPPVAVPAKPKMPSF